MRPDLAARFWSKVAKKDATECWLWTAGRNASGYGKFALTHRTTTGAHRVAWMLTNGEVPAGLFVCHRCDNPSCANPAHLFLGTAAENTADMMRKGRYVKHTNGNERKAVCVRGHALDKANVRHYRGGRTCRACQRAFQRAYRAGKAA